MWVNHIQDEKAESRLLDNALDGGFTPKSKITQQQVKLLQSAVNSVIVPKEVRAMLQECFRTVKAEGLNLSQRELIQSALLLKTSAALSGSGVVTEDHFELLPLCWAGDAPEVATIKTAMNRIVLAKTKAFNDYKKKVQDYSQAVDTINAQNMQQVVTQGRTLKQEGQTLMSNATGARLAQLETLNKQVESLAANAFQFLTLELS